jgi:hypothetical protein
MAQFPGHYVGKMDIGIGSLGPNPSPGGSGGPQPPSQTEQFPQGPMQPGVMPTPGSGGGSQ